MYKVVLSHIITTQSV